jgi:hypothetical protein
MWVLLIPDSVFARAPERMVTRREEFTFMLVTQEVGISENV